MDHILDQLMLISHQMGSMYWYLSELATAQSKLIQHIDNYLKERISQRPTSMPDCIASETYFHSMHFSAEATKAMASALSTLFFHLQELGVISSPKREFSKRQLFYEARMKPYLGVSNDQIPTALDLEKARKANTGRLTEEVCEHIDNEIRRAKRLLTEVKGLSLQEGKFVGTEEQFKKEIKALETTCVAAAVNSSQLGRLVEKHGVEGITDKLEYTMGRRWHEWWVVPVLKEKK